MNRLFFILLFTFGLAAGILPAQQSAPGPKNSSGQPAGKRPPQAKTQAEYADYNAAYALKGGASVEKAADDFAQKYPDSELKPYLFTKAEHEYQAENNSAKMLAMGEKVLKLDPDNTVSLVLTATILSDSLSTADSDEQQKVSTIKLRVAHALENVDNTTLGITGIPQDQITSYKNTLRSMAHSALGITSLKLGDNAEAETELKLAAGLGQAQPDPYIWYHLALAQDRQGTAAVNTDEQKKKYSEALVSIREALRYTASNPDLGKLADGELKRLQQLTGQESGPAAPPQPQPSPSQQQK